MPSAVAQHALDKGFPSDLIFTPVKAGEVMTFAMYELFLKTYSFQWKFWNKMNQAEVSLGNLEGLAGRAADIYTYY